MKVKLFKMASISEILGLKRTSIRADYDKPKYQEAIQELKDFENAWIKKWGVKNGG